MPHITLRLKAGAASEGDVVAEVKEATFEYLLNSDATSVRVSAYLDRDWPQVEPRYAELFLVEDCDFDLHVLRLSPGSRTRTGIQLPGPMFQGEQLTVEVKRTPR